MPQPEVNKKDFDLLTQKVKKLSAHIMNLEIEIVTLKLFLTAENLIDSKLFEEVLIKTKEEFLEQQKEE